MPGKKCLIKEIKEKEKKLLEEKTVTQKAMLKSDSVTVDELAEMKNLRQRMVYLEHENEVLIEKIELLESDKVEVMTIVKISIVRTYKSVYIGLLEHNVSSTQVSKLIEVCLG